MNDDVFELYASFHTVELHKVMDGFGFCNVLCKHCQAFDLCNVTPSCYKPTVSKEFILEKNPEYLI